MYKSITVSADIPEKKLLNAFKKGILTLKPSELSGSGATMMLHPESHSKAMKMKKHNKGTRLHITKDEIKASLDKDEGGSLDGAGGSIWKKIWSGIKSAWNPVIKPALSAALDAGAPALSTFLSGSPSAGPMIRQATKALTGIGVKPKRLVKGSDEAKEYMKSIRPLKGSSFRLD